MIKRIYRCLTTKNILRTWGKRNWIYVITNMAHGETGHFVELCFPTGGKHSMPKLIVTSGACLYDAVVKAHKKAERLIDDYKRGVPIINDQYVKNYKSAFIKVTGRPFRDMFSDAFNNKKHWE